MFFFNNEKKKYLEILANYGLPVNGNSWWVRYPKRAAEEIYKMQENTYAALSYDANRLIWTESIVNNFDTPFVISIETDSNYPFSMPNSFVKDPYIAPGNDRHIFADGSLCLFDSSDYNSQMSILEIRGHVCTFCFCIEVYLNTKHWPAAGH